MAANDSLASLHTALVDVCNGYGTAIDRTEEPNVKALLTRVKSLHEEAHAELHKALVARGLSPDDNGSFMGTVHKAVITARSAISGLDEGSLPAFASGEEMLAKDYDAAIQETSDDDSLVALLQRQKAQLEPEISRMRAMAESA